jgi:hypothetical protein
MRGTHDRRSPEERRFWDEFPGLNMDDPECPYNDLVGILRDTAHRYWHPKAAAAERRAAEPIHYGRLYLTCPWCQGKIPCGSVLAESTEDANRLCARMAEAVAIVRALAAFVPWGEDRLHRCSFCRFPRDLYGRPPMHDAICLYRRACEWVAANPERVDADYVNESGVHISIHGRVD